MVSRFLVAGGVPRHCWWYMLALPALALGIALSASNAFAGAPVPANLIGVSAATNPGKSDRLFPQDGAGPTFTPTGTPTYTPTPTLTPTATPTGGGVPPSLVIHVMFQGMAATTPNPRYTTDTLTTTLRLMGGGPDLEFGPQAPDAVGFYTINVRTVPNGTYTIRAKGHKNLSNGGPALCDTVTLTGAPVIQKDLGTLRAGDALTTGPTNFNVVNASDFTTLKNTFGKSYGQSGYDERADFNQTDNVDATDFSLMKGNFGSAGCPNP